MLLLHVYNVHYNQENNFTIKDEKITGPAWSLKIQGKLVYPNIESFEDIDKTSSYMKMTHFIRKVEISFNKDQAISCPLIEWENNEFSCSKDGLDITREGNSELDMQISIWLKYYPKQFKPKPALSQIIGFRQCTKLHAISAIWEYIKMKKLQDLNDHKIIRCNKELYNLFGKDSIEFSYLSIKINELLEEPDPYRISYKLKYFLDFAIVNKTV